MKDIVYVKVILCNSLIKGLNVKTILFRKLFLSMVKYNFWPFTCSFVYFRNGGIVFRKRWKIQVLYF